MPTTAVSRIPSDACRPPSRFASGVFARASAGLFSLLLFALLLCAGSLPVRAAGGEGAPSRAAGHQASRHGIGSVAAWGYDGDGETDVPAGLSKNLTAIAAGGEHSLALKSDGTVAAWGDDSSGQSDVPVGLSGVTAIAAGYYHSLALKSDGTVAAWGYDGDGETDVPAGLSGVTAIAAGEYHSLALKSDGTVVAWGADVRGQTNVPAGLSGVVAIAAGQYHSLALKSDGTVVGWGYDVDGETDVPAGLSGVVAIAADGFHSLALKSDGTVVAWGSNQFGETTVPAGLSGVVAIAAGVNHSLALKSDGTVVGWGFDAEGETTVPAGLSGVVAIAAGQYHSLALRSDGSLVSGFGDDAKGQTTVPAGASGAIAIAAGYQYSLALKSDGTVVAWGDDSYHKIDVPAGLSGVTAIAAGGEHSLALKSDGTVVAWGDDTYHQIDVPAGLSGVKAIACGFDHSLALKSDGTVVAWGDDTYHQIDVPANLSGVVAIAAGTLHSLALKSDGTVVAWSYDGSGQTSVPAGLSGVTAIAAGGFHSLALQSDGTVVAWGGNSDGQSTVPAGLSGVAAIAASGYHSLALQSDGTVVAWGDNSDGQSTVPSGLSGVAAIAAGDAHSLVISTLLSDKLTAQGGTFTPTAEQSFNGTVATFTDTNTATASSAFSATIDWGDTTTSTGTVSGSAGSFSVSGTHTYALPGQYTVTTTITGPGGPVQATGTANVGGAYASTVVHNSPNPSVYGQSVAATVTVTDGSTDAPVTEGSVQFSVGGVNVGTPQTLNAQGKATYSTSSLPVGTTRITGTYSDTGGKYAGGTSFEDQKVNQADTTTSVSPNPSSPDDTQTITFTATVAPVAPGAGTPTGSVIFTINGAQQTIPLSNGVAVAGPSGPFAPGPVSYSAAYQSDTDFKGSSSGPQSVIVNPGAATHFVVSAPGTATAGIAMNVTVTAKDALGYTATGYTGTVQFTSSDGQAALPANTTLTNGVGTFSVTLKTAGHQTITATDAVTSALTGTSGSVGVSAAAPAIVAFVQQPTGAGQNATIAPSPSVKVTDAFGNPITSDSITLSLTTGTGTLSGIITQTTGSNGVATFPGLSINLPGSKNLTATAGPLSVQSNAFTIADTTPPVTVGGNTSAPGAVQVTLSATDNFSGVASTTYQIDNGSAVTVANSGNASPFVTQFVVTTAGPHFITYYSTDGAGNKEAAKTLRFPVTANGIPTLTSLSPTGTDAQAAHADLVLTLTGSGFVQGFDAAHSSIVTFSGTPLVTTYISPSKLTAVIPGALLASAGVFNVAVVNPAPGGGTSGSKTFTVQSNSLTGVTLSNGSAGIVGGMSVTGTVTLQHPALGTDVVTLTSSNPAVLNVPPSVTLVPGSYVATFPAVSVPVAVDTPVTITARYNGVVKSVTTLVLAPRVVTLSVSSLSIKGGQTFTVQAGLSSPAPAGAWWSLWSRRERRQGWVFRCQFRRRFWWPGVPRGRRYRSVPRR